LIEHLTGRHSEAQAARSQLASSFLRLMFCNRSLARKLLAGVIRIGGDVEIELKVVRTSVDASYSSSF
jgi:hypothetical protein